MRGFFEHADRKGLSGWLDPESGPVPLVALIDGERRIAIDPASFRPMDSGRIRFAMPLALAAGSRLEILNAETGERLGGGVRFIAKPRWTPRIAIVAPVKSEARYLIEWIAYHRVLGVRQFYLADNGGDDGTSELLQVLDATGVIVRLDWRGAKYFQMDFYNKTVPRLIGLADIVAVIDCDEFFRPLDGCASLTEAVAGYFSNPKVVVVGINWASYGSSGRISTGDGLVLERFTRRAPQDFDPNQMIKCLIRPRDFIPNNPGPHFFNFDRPGGHYINSRGDEVEWVRPGQLGCTKHVVWNTLRLDHFSIKSRDEYRLKISRGAVLNAHNIGNDEYFRRHDVNDIEDPANAGVVARTRIEMERIKSRLAHAPSLWRRFDLAALQRRRRLAESHYDTRD